MDSYESDSSDGVQPRMVEVPAEEWERVNKQRDLARAALEAAKAEFEHAFSFGKLYRNGEVYYDPADLLKESQTYQAIIAALAALSRLEVQP